MRSQLSIDYTSRKSAENAQEAQSEYHQRREAYTRDCEALELMQASRPRKVGDAQGTTWLALYGHRKPYRAVMRNGQVVLA